MLMGFSSMCGEGYLPLGKPSKSQYACSSEVSLSSLVDSAAACGDGSHHMLAATEARHGVVKCRDILGTKYNGPADVRQEVIHPFKA